MSNRSDDFSGTFPTPSDGAGDYTNPRGTFSNSGGVCSESTGTADSTAVLETSSTQGIVEVTTPAAGSSRGLAIFMRYVDADNYIVLRISASDGFGELYKVVAGVATSLNFTGSYTGANGDTWSLEVDGADAYTFKHNGSTVNWFGGGPTFTDSTHSSGTKHGFGRGGGGGTWTYEDFSFTDTGGGGGGATSRPAFRRRRFFR